MKPMQNDQGMSLVEVMVSAVIAGIALMGMLGAVEISSRYAQQSVMSSRAMELAQARLDMKRSVQWPLLLEDDLDRDGIAETHMTDDGTGPDVTAGDGVYTAMHERDGITVVWAVETDLPGPLSATGMVRIRATASYAGRNNEKREVQMATMRANPSYVGQR
ncbi:MAG: type II secretion system GspH family protein [Nitrospira sp.]|nr:type II secretion system GspH family protein [Nitrospira sp.]MDH4302825.1 type II secretion system GspH family protein [Nitrospira sp.]MDH5192301.1 type II secretion system GspH family protein [Nitrospira sp.]